MAIEFDYATGQYMNFGAPSAVNGLTTKTIVVRFIIDTWKDSANPFYIIDKYNSSGWRVFVGSSSHRVQFSQQFSVTDGLWVTPNDSIALDTEYVVTIAYDNTSVANNPLIYINGTLQSRTETFTPSGTPASDTGADLHIGGTATLYSLDGIVRESRIYNRILSAQEIADIYSSRCIGDNEWGLVFHAPFLGAAGQPTIDGVTLGATNYLIDRIGGAQGTPVGNPVGRGETLLSVCP